MGVEAHNERKKDGHKMYGRSQKCIQNDGSWINGRFAKEKKKGYRDWMVEVSNENCECWKNNKFDQRDKGWV